ncbi:MAG: AtpZ/AtpI family protein [Lachnospiraceae bacterium]|nr:AtpZ/AtpI family protein [Lachnospiraceae bacterium]
MAKNRKSNDLKMIWDALIMVLQFGISMIVPILLCTLFGVWLGERTGISWLAIPLFFVGAIAGGQNVYRMAKKFMK